jgi:hypothetical protein
VPHHQGIRATAHEKSRHIKLDTVLGTAIQNLITIASDRTLITVPGAERIKTQILRA